MISGLILSGGASRRMGTPKALLDLDGETFLDRLIGVYSDVCSPLIVVLGHGADGIRAGLASRSQDVRFVRNPDPERGMLSSLQCGLAEVPSTADAVIFTPVDYPDVRPETLRRIVDAFRTHRAPVTLPTYAGNHGHPVCVSRAVADQLTALPPTAQARDVIRAHRAATVFVEVQDPGILSDIDTREDYLELLAQRA